MGDDSGRAGSLAPRQFAWVGDEVNGNDSAVDDREADDSERMVQVAEHRAGCAVDDRRTHAGDIARGRGKHLCGHGARTMDRRPGARSRWSEIGSEDDLRVKDGKQRLEVTAAGSGKEGSDSSSLLR